MAIISFEDTTLPNCVGRVLNSMNINISEINIFPIAQKESLLGFGSFLINNCLRISGVALHTTTKGRIKLVFPAKRLGSGYQFYCQPTDKETYELIRNKFEEKAKEIGLFNL